MSTDLSRYIVAGSRPWNRQLFDRELKKLPGIWEFAADSNALSELLSSGDVPRYLFFLHWSVRVPEEVFTRYECVCFHMTDVPYGRGGSPLQNLIIRGHRETKLTALRMVSEMDAGPVYLKEPLSLEGSAKDIYSRAGYISARMIQTIIQTHPQPVPQVGEPVCFKRRTPDQSLVPSDLPSAAALYDFIRMLDAEGYPSAFIEHGGFLWEFTEAAQDDGVVNARVRIRRLGAS
jgi:methionyl-tRNA formyltransferase